MVSETLALAPVDLQTKTRSHINFNLVCLASARATSSKLLDRSLGSRSDLGTTAALSDGIARSSSLYKLMMVDKNHRRLWRQSQYLDNILGPIIRPLSPAPSHHT